MKTKLSPKLIIRFSRVKIKKAKKRITAYLGDNFPVLNPRLKTIY